MIRRMATYLLLLSAILSAEDTDARARMQQLTSLPLASDSRDYQLGPGDLIDITVFGVDELDQVVRVSSVGAITLPLIGRIVAAGLTGQDLEARIRELLTERKLVHDPQVTVFTREYRSQPVYVLGAVNQPGQYMVTNQLRLLDALTLAGGLDTKTAGSYLLLQRRSDATAGESRALQKRGKGDTSLGRKIDLDALLGEGDLSLNIVLQGGDVIQVPEKEVEQFYVVGDVQRAGAFSFGQYNNVSVLTALAFAGGFGRTANLQKARILREVAGQPTRRHIEVNIKEIMLGKMEDIALRSEDVLVVPTSGSKAFQAYVLPAAVAAGIGSLIWAGFVR